MKTRQERGLQRFFRTRFCTFKAEDAFRAVFAFSGIVCHINIHRTYLFTFAAGNAFAFVALDSEQGKVTHRLQENGDRTDVFTKSPIVLADKCKDDPDSVIKNVAYDKAPEHDLFYVSDMSQKQRRDKQK